MKNNILSILLITSLLTGQSCGTKINLDKNIISELYENMEFTFMAHKAIPTSTEIINIANNLPHSFGNRILELDYGYSIVIKKDEIHCTLPYFGRMFTPSINTEKNSFRFTSKNFIISKDENKNKKKILYITPKDIQHIQTIILEIFPNGRVITSINSTDRQPISYDGIMIKNQ